MEINETVPQVPPPPAAPAAAPGAIKVNKLVYHGETGTMYGLWFKKLFLSIITIGIYSFWGKTAIRRYIVGSTELEGDRFEYHGTGKELFVGMLKIFPIYLAFALFVGFLQVHYGDQAGSFAILPIVLIMPVAMYSAFRYRMNRLSWRGIRFRMQGSAFSYAGLWLKGAFLNIITLGFMSPSVDLGRWEYQAQNMQYGTMPFAYKGKPENLRKINVITLLLAIPTLFFSRIWYGAALQAEKMRGLSLGPIRFRSTAKGGDFVGLALGNLGILIITLGLGMPIILQRNAKFFTRFLAVGGELSQLQVGQVERGKANDAEALDSALDIDLGMIGA